MTGRFDPGGYTAAPLQTEGVIRFGGSPDTVFARIANHPAMTDWVPLLKTVQVSHPKPLPPGESMLGTTRVLALRGGVTIREEVVYWDPPRCYAYTTEGKHWPMRNYVGLPSGAKPPVRRRVMPSLTRISIWVPAASSREMRGAPGKFRSMIHSRPGVNTCG